MMTIMTEDANEELLHGDAMPWMPPQMAGGFVRTEDLAVSQAPSLPTAQQFEDWEKEGRNNGFSQGHQEGYQAGLAEAQALLQDKVLLLDKILQNMTRPLIEVDEEAERELVTLSVNIAQQLVRREIKQDPNIIIGVIREGLALLPSNAVGVTLHVHPDDARLIRETLAPADGDAYEWVLKENPLISRGGCQIDTQQSHIDATIETRLTQLAASVLNGARRDD